ncbi:MAG: asparaginase [Pseudomonadota bacterium]
MGGRFQMMKPDASVAQQAPPVLVEVWRGPMVESRHRGSLAVVAASGEVRAALGDIGRKVFMRSMAKPIQALPLIESGAADRYGLTDTELAAMCGSLNGEDFQARVVAGILRRAGLAENSLLCGIQRPSHRPTARRLDAAKEPVSALRHNCAGKHAAMLLLCVHHGWPLEDYPAASHPVQRLMLSRVADFCSVPPAEVAVGTDGCGVPVFGVPLGGIALAYARLAGASRPAVARLVAACLAHPEMIGGEGRICTDAMRAAPGVLAKTGAEGGYALALTRQGLGVALKVDDGAPRAVQSCVAEILDNLGLLDDDGRLALARYRNPEVRNFRGEVVGEIRPLLRAIM